MICYLTRGLWNARTCLVLEKLDWLIQKSMKQLQFALAQIPLTLVLRKVKAGYNLGNGLPIINNLLFTDDLKVYGKSENHVDTVLQSLLVVSEDIRHNGNWNRKMCSPVN